MYFLYFGVMILLCLFFFFFQETKIQVTEIKIEGHSITEEEIIRREILFTEGARISKKDIERSLKRIENLNIFTSVNSSVEKIDNENARVIYHVYEKFPVMASLILKSNGASTDDLTYGLSLRYFNAFGKNHKLDLLYFQGYDNGYSGSYFNPWTLGDLRLSYSVYSSGYKLRNPNSKYLNTFYMNRNHGIVLGRGFGPYWRLFSGFEWERNDFSENLRVQGFHESQHDDILKYSIGFSYDTRDFHSFPTSGGYLKSSLMYQDILNTRDAYAIIGDLSVARFLALNPHHIIAFNANSSHTMGNPVYYQKQIYMGQNLLRGYDFMPKLGDHSFVSRLEYRFKFIDDFFWSVDLPFVRDYLTRIRTSIYLYGFNDTGILYDSVTKIESDTVFNSFGFGVGILTPYFQSTYLEYSKNREGLDSFRLRFGLLF